MYGAKQEKTIPVRKPGQGLARIKYSLTILAHPLFGPSGGCNACHWIPAPAPLTIGGLAPGRFSERARWAIDLRRNPRAAPSTDQSVSTTKSFMIDTATAPKIVTGSLPVAGAFDKMPAPAESQIVSGTMSLSDEQLASVMRATLRLPVEKRSALLRRIAARLHLSGKPISTIAGLDNAVRVALRDLIQESGGLAPIRWITTPGGISGNRIRPDRFRTGTL